MLITSPHADVSNIPSRAAAASDETEVTLSADEIVSQVLTRLDEEKAEDIVTIDLTGKSDVADKLVIASGRSQRHVGALADKLGRSLKESGLGHVATEGLPACDWVLLDAGDVIVHLFRPEVRDFYNLERIWAPERFPPTSAE
ncbi:MAG: ribosome silencing factor [Pseudomonadota bacterium]